MEQISALTDNFLIAMPNMNDPNFSHSVTYICEHNENGALGLVINRPSSVKLAEVFSQMEIKYKNVDASDMHILFGGPINQERGFVIHQPQKPWRSSFMTSDDIMITTSKDILEALAQSQGPKKALITLGYAGWDPGQLEQEIADNVWLHCKADPEIIFNVPYDQRWIAAGKLLGIDLNALSGQAGHA